MKTKWGISGSVLKWFAVITMVIDHFGASVLETYVMNVWGRSPLGNLFSDHWNELLRVDRILWYIGPAGLSYFLFPFGGRISSYQGCEKICHAAGNFCTDQRDSF